MACDGSKWSLECITDKLERIAEKNDTPHKFRDNKDLDDNHSVLKALSNCCV